VEYKYFCFVLASGEGMWFINLEVFRKLKLIPKFILNKVFSTAAFYGWFNY
jgi:hypothetical protein